MPRSPSCVALIPARAGSKRVPGKNTRPLGGHPLLAYSIGAALESGVFSAVVVSSEDAATLQVARDYGAQGLVKRAAELAADDSPDFGWVAEAMLPGPFDCFSILRPTSPFRTAETIRRAWGQWLEECWWADSLRAMEPCGQHPGKMWQIDGQGCAWPLLSEEYWGMPWAHSRPTQTLPRIYVQNASLEIAWTRVLREQGNISGRKVTPFLTSGREGFDINTEDDWALAEYLIETGQAKLPEVLFGS